MQKGIETKFDLIFYYQKSSEFINTKEPLSKLIFDLYDIKTIFKNKTKINLFLLLYINKTYIHSLLYKYDEIIIIKYEDIMTTLSSNFYFNLLIKEDPYIVNYSYSTNLITAIFNETNLIKGQIKFTMMLICLICLINNFKETGEFKENEDGEKIKEIENECYTKIVNNMDILKEINVKIDIKNIKNKKIDILYTEIISFLIKNRKFEDYDYTMDILNQLDIPNIILTKSMSDELLKLLDGNENYVNDYLIKNLDEFSNEKKINFYYILIKYIFKSSIFIYYSPFFLIPKLLIIKNLKIKKIKINIIKKCEYIIEMLCDSKYYYNIYLENKYLELQEVKTYYKNFLFESKKEDINNIEKIIKYNENDFDIYLKDHELSKYMNLRAPIIDYLYNSINNGIIKNEENYNKEVKNFKIIEKNILERKIEKLQKQTKNLLNIYFKNENNKEILLKVFKKNDIDYFINQFAEELNEIKKEKLLIQNENKNNIILPIDFNNYKNKNILSKNDLDIHKDNVFESKSNIKKDKNKINANKDIIIKKIQNKKDYSISLINKGDINEDIISFLLNKSSFYLNTVIKSQNKIFKYYKILCGEYNIELPYQRIMEFKSFYSDNNQNNILAKNFILLCDFLNEITDKLRNKFLYQYNLRLRLDFKKEDNNNNSNSILYNITCIYTFYEPLNNKIHTYKDTNILINGTNSMSQGYEFLINDINNGKFENIIYKEYNLYKKDIIDNNELKYKNKEENKQEESSIIFNESTRMQTTFIPLKNNATLKEEIIEPQKIIGRHKDSANFIIEISIGYVSAGNENALTLYDYNYIEKMKINDFNDSIYKVVEKKSSKEKNESYITLYCCTFLELIVLKIGKKNFSVEFKKYNIPKKTIINLIEMKENNIVIIGKGCYYYNDLFDLNGQFSEYKIAEDTYRGGIKINDKIVALTSNSIIPNGKDKLIFYNIKTKKISNEINEYSFACSTNNLILMPTEEIKQYNKVILCACKKYSKDQKNGILLVNPNLGDNKRIENEFYDTENFEVYCFCPILKFKNNNNGKDEESKSLIDTNYLFVGGYDLDKREGKIKLFKVIYGEKSWKTKIKFIQNIEFLENKNFEDFNGPISSIIQSRFSGNIIATCYNRNVYLFTQPNLDYYFEKDIF